MFYIHRNNYFNRKSMTFDPGWEREWRVCTSAQLVWVWVSIQQKANRAKPKQAIDFWNIVFLLASLLASKARSSHEKNCYESIFYLIDKYFMTVESWANADKWDDNSRELHQNSLQEILLGIFIAMISIPLKCKFKVAWRQAVVMKKIKVKSQQNHFMPLPERSNLFTKHSKKRKTSIFFFSSFFVSVFISSVWLILRRGE